MCLPRLVQFPRLVILVLAILTAPVFASAQSGQQSPAAEQSVDRARGGSLTAEAPREYTLPPERAAKAIAYAAARRRIYFFDFVWGLIVLWLLLRWGIATKFRDWAERVSRRRIVQAAIFAPLVLATLELADLPASIARHWLALDYRISVQGWLSWASDLAKGLVLQFLLGAFLVWLLYAVIRASPRRWWFYGWLAAVPIMVFGVFITPWLVDPLFFDFTPLAPAHPELAAQIERITERAGRPIPETRMFVMNASSKLNALNAYMTGLGASRRVVVWDTTIHRLSTDEVLSVFSHELGHYVLGHVRNGVIFAAAMMLAGLFAASRIFPWVVHRWGTGWGLGRIEDWASLPALLLVISLLNFAATPISNAYSRHIEQQADQYGLEVLHGLIPDSTAAAARSLQILGDEDLEEPSPSSATVFWFYTHPPIRDRIAFAWNYDPWAAGHSPEFVK